MRPITPSAYPTTRRPSYRFLLLKNPTEAKTNKQTQKKKTKKQKQKNPSNPLYQKTYFLGAVKH